MRRTLLVTGTLLGLLVANGCGGSTPSAGPRTRAASVVATELRGKPVGIASTGSGQVWTVLPSEDEVELVDGAEVAARVPVPGTPLRVAATPDGSAIWVTSFTRGSVARVDTRTRTVTDQVDVGDGAEGVTFAFGSVWVAAQDSGLLVRIDPASRRVVRRVDVGHGVRLVVAGPDALWLDDHVTGSVVRVDPRSGRVRHSDHVCDGPEDLVATTTTVWVTCSAGNEVVALDPATLQPGRTIPLKGTPDSVTAAPDGSLLVVLQDGPTLVRLDGTTGKELGRTVLGREKQLYDQANLDVVVTGNDAWVTSFAGRRVLRTPWQR